MGSGPRFQILLATRRIHESVAAKVIRLDLLFQWTSTGSMNAESAVPIKQNPLLQKETMT